MQAEAIVEAVCRGGQSTVVRIRSEPPLTLRRTRGRCEVHLVGSSAGPIGGDDLVLRVRVGPGAELTLRSVAASLVLPGPAGLPSSFSLDAAVHAGGRLVVAPEPQILVRGCDHRMRTHVRLATGASLAWADETVLGRHDDEPGSLSHRVRIDRAGRPLLRTDLAVGPAWPASLGPAGVDGARALATWVRIGQEAGARGRVAALDGPRDGDRARAATLPLADDARVISAVGASLDEARRAAAGALLCACAGFVST